MITTLTIIGIVIIATVAWGACGRLAYLGIYTACQKEFPLIAEENQNKGAKQDFLLSLFGPFALLVGFGVYCHYKHGFTRLSIEEVRRFKREKYPQWTELFDEDEEEA
ncbi:hypothetical protein LCGC14_0532520 [marine sediment metagenome]|uniref:Uncharacterized protein n=1 Tax=marine sediment metagenome TaxID=412755 RepID=A0A0F9V3G0_9ZZZZ